MKDVTGILVQLSIDFLHLKSCVLSVYNQTIKQRDVFWGAQKKNPCSATIQYPLGKDCMFCGFCFVELIIQDRHEPFEPERFHSGF